MAFKQLSIPLRDIKRNPSEGVLSFCKSPSLFSKLFGEPRVLLKKCQIQEIQEDHIHGTKRTLKNLKSVDYELGSESSEHTSSHEEQEDHIHGRKRTLRDLKSDDYELGSGSSEHASSDEIQEDHVHGTKRTLKNMKSEDYELGSESSEHTSSHDEKEVHSHYTKKEFSNGICLKKKKHASKRSKVSIHESAPISDYQKMIAERNKEQLALLRSVGVIQEEQEDDRKRSLRNLKSVKYAENESDRSTSDEDFELDSENSGHTSSDDEEKFRSRNRKKEFGNKKSHKNKKRASKRSKVSKRKVKFAESESDYSTSDESLSLSSSLPESSELDSQSSGHTSSDEEEEGRRHYKKKSHSVPLNDYEKMIAERNKERLALLSSLGVMEVKYAENESDHSTSDEDFKLDSENSGHTSSDDEKKFRSRHRKKGFGNKKSHAKDDFCGIVRNLKPKHVKKVTKAPWPTVQERCSQRLAKQTSSIDYNEDAMHEQNIEKQQEENSKPLEMSFKTALKYPEMYGNYLEDFNLQNSIAECADVHYDENVLGKLILDECSFIEVVPSCPTVLAWYPSSEDLILAAGDSYGWLGIYKLGPEYDPYVFKPHYAKITNLLFNPLNRVHMVSSSNDGSVQCADLVKHTFTKIYDTKSPSVSHAYFDFLSLTTCLVTQNSTVVLIDYRTNRITGEMTHRCHKGAISTVHVHPVHKHNFVTAGHDSFIHLWDLRMLRDNTPITYHVHNYPVQCAYFSPGTGNFILSATARDISIIESLDMTQSIETKKEFGKEGLSIHGSLRDNKRRTPHLRNAKWLPDSQSMFVVNHTHYQDSIKVCVKDTEVCHKIQQENLRVKGLSTFHPCKPVLAGVAVHDYFFFFSYES